MKIVLIVILAVLIVLSALYFIKINRVDDAIYVMLFGIFGISITVQLINIGRKLRR